jgi:hypothetical protein
VAPDGDRLMKMLAWTVLDDQPYSTYLRVG